MQNPRILMIGSSKYVSRAFVGVGSESLYRSRRRVSGVMQESESLAVERKFDFGTNLAVSWKIHGASRTGSSRRGGASRGIGKDRGKSGRGQARDGMDRGCTMIDICETSYREWDERLNPRDAWDENGQPIRVDQGRRFDVIPQGDLFAIDDIPVVAIVDRESGEIVATVC